MSHLASSEPPFLTTPFEVQVLVVSPPPLPRRFLLIVFACLPACLSGEETFMLAHISRAFSIPYPVAEGMDLGKLGRFLALPISWLS